MQDHVIANRPGARLFPPLGRVKVRVVPVTSRDGQCRVRISGTSEVVTVEPGTLTDDQGSQWAPGLLIERVKEPGRWFGSCYFGKVMICRRPIMVPVGIDSRNLAVA